jgi:predicted PolB exonuclease-like 3'-5' exonuclease
VSSSLVLSLETIPDVPRIRQLFGLGSMLSDADVADYAFQRQRAQGGSDTLPYHLQRVVLVTCLRRDDGQIAVLSLQDDEGEAQLLASLFALTINLKPQIIAWQAEEFVLPLLQCRAMLHGIDGDCGWLTNDEPHVPFGDMASVPGVFDLSRHLEFGPVPPTRSPLADFARLAGIPAQADPDAVVAWQIWREGRTSEIQSGCERRVLMSYLVFLRYLQAKGQVSGEQRAVEERLLRAELGRMELVCADEFLRDWPDY